MTLDALPELLRRSHRPVLVTGAGISVASGIPTYRGPDGLWTLHPDHPGLSGAPPVDATADERRVWWDASFALHAPIREALLHSGPNAAHLAITRWQQSAPDLAVVTQNADELHQRAGTREVFPIHGTFLADRCADPDCPQAPWPDPEPRAVAPDCPTCAGPARLDAVVFGEPLDQALYHLAKRAVKHADLVVVVGTTGAVSTAGNLPALANDYDVACVRIDPGPWEGRPVPWVAEISAPAEETLPALVEVACGG